MFPLVDPITFVWCVFLCILFYLIKLALIGAYFDGKERLDGKVVIITGSNTGIGKQTALELAKRGASVILACRNVTKATEAVTYIQKETGNQSVRFRQLDLSSLESCRNFVAIIQREETSLYALVNNAGVFWCPLTRTEDGFELNIGVNHLGHFAITILLLPLLYASADVSRIVTVSSVMHAFGKLDFTDLHYEKRNYNFVSAYSASKLANLFFSQKLSTRLRGSKINTYCVDPGIVKTDIGRMSFIMNSFFYRVILRPITWLIFKDSKAGAQTSIYCVCSDNLKSETGKLYAECDRRSPWSTAYDNKTSDKLWEESLRLTNLSEECLHFIKQD